MLTDGERALRDRVTAFLDDLPDDARGTTAFAQLRAVIDSWRTPPS